MRRCTAAGRAAAALAASALLATGGCGRGEDRPGQVTSDSRSRAPSTSSPSASRAGGPAARASGGYAPASDVEEAVAIGRDVTAVEQLLAGAERRAVDWAAVREVWAGSGAPLRKGGRARALRALVPVDALVGTVDDAIAGTGRAAPTEALRARQVRTAISVVLARTVVEELASAREEAAAGDVGAGSGALHAVDAAGVLFTVGAPHFAAIAGGRAARSDGAGGGVAVGAVVAALGRAQEAAMRGDVTALAAAGHEVAGRIDRAYFVATSERLGSASEGRRVEGATSFLALAARVRAADADAAAAIEAAFAGGDPTAGRAALHRPAVLEALGIDPSELPDP